MHPTQPPFDTTYARLLIADVAEADARVRATFAPQWADEGLAPPRMDVAGGHRTAIETESLMRGEAASNTLWSMVGVLALLYLAFRNAWLVLFGTLPILLGTLVTLALHQVAGVQLSAAATGASAMLFGLGDDGLVLLFVAYRDRLARGLSPIDAVRDLGGIGVSVLARRRHDRRHVPRPLVHVVPEPAAARPRRRAGDAADGVLHADGAGRGAARAGMGGAVTRSVDARTRAVGRAAIDARFSPSRIVISLPLGWGLTKLHVDPRIERLRPVTAGLALETEITERFGLARDVYLVLSRGPALEPLLEAHEALDGRLGTTEGLAHVGPSVVLPSETVQAARRSQLAREARRARPARRCRRRGRRRAGLRGRHVPAVPRTPRTRAGPGAGAHARRPAGPGLGDIVGRFVRRDGPDYLVATYATAATPAALSTLHAAIAPDARLTLTGLPMVNAALAARFPRELSAGIGAGALVVVLLIWLEFRAVRPDAAGPDSHHLRHHLGAGRCSDGRASCSTCSASSRS